MDLQKKMLESCSSWIKFWYLCMSLFLHDTIWYHSVYFCALQNWLRQLDLVHGNKKNGKVMEELETKAMYAQ